MFCQSESGGTIHINTVEIDTHNAKDAAVAGRAFCAYDWECSQNSVRVLGVVEGSVQPVLWDDDGLDLPNPQVLRSIRIDFDAWPGAPFQGGKIIELEREGLDGPHGIAAALEEVDDLLEDLADDDPSGPLFGQIEKAVAEMVDQDGSAKRICFVSPSGRYKGGKLHESFDITVSIIPVIGDEPED